MSRAATMSGRADEDLLRRACVGGDRGALGELAGRYEAALLGLARGVLGGREDLAMDAVQESWVRVIRFGAGFRGGSSVKTWLYRIVINQCRTMLGARRIAGLGAEAVAGMPGGGGEGAAAGDGALPSRAAEEAEAAAAVRRAVDELGESRRELVLLCYHAGLTHEEAAGVLEIPVGTLKSRLHAALEQLRSALAGAERCA